MNISAKKFELQFLFHSEICIDDMSYEHTDASLQFIKDFDAGKIVKPQTFCLEMRA